MVVTAYVIFKQFVLWNLSKSRISMICPHTERVLQACAERNTMHAIATTPRHYGKR